MKVQTEGERAERAYTRVSRHARGDGWKQYRTIALKLPVMIHNEGLVPALHFVAARSHRDQRVILDDLARDLELSDAAELLARVRTLGPRELRETTRAVQRQVGWYKRMVQSFGKDPLNPVESP